MPCESYAGVLQAIAPDGVCDLAFPADEGANLPDPGGLQSYDGVVLTGSALNVYDATPEITRQVDLMRAVYASGTPAFGSCWGLQIGAVAAGGDVRRNPEGREIGFARRIVPTEAGGRMRCSPGAPPPTMRRRSTSTSSPSRRPIARCSPRTPCRRSRPPRSAWTAAPSGACSTIPSSASRNSPRSWSAGSRSWLPRVSATRWKDAASYVADLTALHAEPARRDLAWRHGLDEEVLDPVRRTGEIRRFVEERVKPEKSARGRA